MMSILVLLALVGRIGSLPIGSAKESTAVDVTSLTVCERNMQLKCINKYGTEGLLRGIGGTPCNVSKLVDCMNAEKNKTECHVDDFGTVYYIEAFLRHVDVNKCMDDFDFFQVQHLFKTSSQKNVHEFSNAHRTYSSGEHGSFPYHPDDNEVGDDDDDDHAEGSGSGSV